MYSAYPTTSFNASYHIERLRSLDIRLDYAIESGKVPQERTLAMCIAGSIILADLKRIPPVFFTENEVDLVTYVSNRVEGILSEFGDSLKQQYGTPTYGTPETGTPTYGTPETGTPMEDTPNTEEEDYEDEYPPNNDDETNNWGAY